MIGLSIYEDAIRAVRVKKTGNKLILREHREVLLPEYVIINGDLVDENAFAAALADLRDAMEIFPEEDIHVGLPSALFKVESLCVRAEEFSYETFLEKTNLDKSFDVRPFFVSGSYKVDTELFERYRLSQEEIDQRMQKQFDEQNGEEEAKPAYTMVKMISYAAILKKNLDTYLEAFKKCDLRVYTIEPNALAYINYLRYDGMQPFMIADVDMDYTSFIIFGEKTGAFMLNGVDLGIENLEVAPSPGAEPVINRGTVDKFIGKTCLAMDFFRDDSITKKEEVQQIILLSNALDYLADALEDALPETDIAISEEMIPAILSEKGINDIPIEELSMFYAPIILASNEDLTFNFNENIERNIETNFLSDAARELLTFQTMKSYATKFAYTAFAASGIYCLAILGTNAFEMVQAGFLQDPPTEILDKYEDAKGKGETLKTNIAKYNALANARTPVSPMIDGAIAAKPSDVYLTNLNVSGKTANTRKLVIECITEHAEAANKYVDNLIQIPGLEKSRILSQQVKNGKVAVQIVASLATQKDAKAERDEKRKTK